MATYHYKAATPKGEVRSGWLEAANEADLEHRLFRLDLLLISHRSGGRESTFLRRDGITRKVLIMFCMHMEQLLRVGASIPVALEEIRDSVPNPRFREVVTSMIEDIRAGKNFSDAMLAYPTVFPPMFTSLIRVGERTGEISKILQSLSDNLKWEDELMVRTKRALRYPLLVGTIVLGLFFFLMIYLAPKLVSFLPEMGAEIPFHTRLLIGISEFVVDWWMVLVLAPAAILVLVDIAQRLSPAFRLGVDRFKLRLFFFGPLMRKVLLVRFANAFALMYRSGIPVLEALDITGRLLGNLEMTRAILSSRERVSDGLSVSASFEETGLFPPPLPRLLHVGEESGQLEEALRNVSYFLDREVRETIDNLQALIEPVLTLFVGGLLAWVILSVLGPIYDSISQISFG